MTKPLTQLQKAKKALKNISKHWLNIGDKVKAHPNNMLSFTGIIEEINKERTQAGIKKDKNNNDFIWIIEKDNDGHWRSDGKGGLHLIKI